MIEIKSINYLHQLQVEKYSKGGILLINKVWIVQAVGVTFILSSLLITIYLYYDMGLNASQLYYNNLHLGDGLVRNKQDFLIEYEENIISEQDKTIVDSNKGSGQISSGTAIWTNSATRWGEGRVSGANEIYYSLKEATIEVNGVTTKIPYVEELICGFIGNMLCEGNPGQIEYQSPYPYWQSVSEEVLNIAGKNLEGHPEYVSILLDEIPVGTEGIGVGMVQWSGVRRVTLLNLYISENCTFTNEDIIRVESKMFAYECLNTYKVVLEMYVDMVSGYSTAEERIQLAAGLVGKRYEGYAGSASDIDSHTYLMKPTLNRYIKAIEAYQLMGK